MPNPPPRAAPSPASPAPASPSPDSPSPASPAPAETSSGSALTLTEAIGRLTAYWAGQGCAIMQPYNTEVGAGTLNPATFLRVLGPEPWRVAYVEPSVRPDDARYGENPNRIQTHTQFQVILKPEPGNSQDLYLGSLAALGIDLAAHDVRFVEDNWASPALGAWGLGWEVWLDGLEITQFTYFQQAGGFSLDPVSVEITYGLERILMALQGVRHFKEIAYAEGLPYGDVFGQAEYEWSRYYLDDADTGRGRRAVRPLRARGGADDRAAPTCARLLLCPQMLAHLQHPGRPRSHQPHGAGSQFRPHAPLGPPGGRPLGPAPGGGGVSTRPGRDLLCAGPTTGSRGAGRRGPRDVSRRARHARVRDRDRGAPRRRGHGHRRDGPRRHRQPPGRDSAGARRRHRKRLTAPGRRVGGRRGASRGGSGRARRGPKRSAAFDPEGTPTKAAEGFARGNGVTTADLLTWEVNGVDYVGIERHVPGRPAVDVLGEILPTIVGDLRSTDRNMRWDAPGLTFVRPIRWIVALLGDAVVPFPVANLTSGRATSVLRSDPDPQRTIPSADAYAAVLQGAGITVDEERRRDLVARAGRRPRHRGGRHRRARSTHCSAR